MTYSLERFDGQQRRFRNQHSVSILDQYEHKLRPTVEERHNWVRLSLMLVADHPLVYHKMAEALHCGKRGVATSLEQSVSKFKPVLYNHS